MNSLKVFLEYPNYYCIGHDHIFINFNQENLKCLIELHPTSIRKIHVFISTHSGINDALRNMVNIFSQLRKNSKKQKARIIIHLSIKTKDLKKLIKEYLKEYDSKYLLMTERFGTTFGLKYLEDYYLNKYSKHMRAHFDIIFGNKSIYPKICDSENILSHRIIKFPEYYFDSKDDQSIFETAEERLHPENFKEKLLEAFKKKCPASILKSFKSDEDIFNYITIKGEWKL